MVIGPKWFRLYAPSSKELDPKDVRAKDYKAFRPTAAFLAWRWRRRGS